MSTGTFHHPIEIGDPRGGRYERVEREVGRTWMRIDGKAEITLVVFGDEGAETLLGAYTLEGLRLGVDPSNRRLVPVPGYLVKT